MLRPAPRKLHCIPVKRFQLAPLPAWMRDLEELDARTVNRMLLADMSRDFRAQAAIVNRQS